jgi:CHRD domain-containing protein
MKKARAAAVAVVLGALAISSNATGAGGARIYRLSATMDPRQVVTVSNKPWPVPETYSKSKGRFTGTFNEATGRLTWTITFSGLARPKLRIVDIHYGTPGRFGAFLARACAGCKSGQRGVIKVKPSARRDIAAGKAWVTLITERYPNGVIRGQIKARRTA